MNFTQNLTEKSFIDQIRILEEIEKNNQQECISDIFKLYANPKKNKETQFFAEGVLKTLLVQNEEKTIEGLQSGIEYLEKICLDIVSEKLFTSAIPVCIELSQRTTDNKNILLLLETLSKFNTDETKQVFRSLFANTDSLISSFAINTIGNLKDECSVPYFVEKCNNYLANDTGESCDLSTAATIQALGKIANQEALTFLVKHIHANNPTFRQLVHEAIGTVGVDVLPYIVPLLKTADIDTTIMAVNILGTIKDKKCVDILIDIVEDKTKINTNILCAVYDSLAAIPCMKSMVCLIDALSTDNLYILTAVINGLNAQALPGVIDKVTSMLLPKTNHSLLLTKAIITSKATNLFKNLFTNPSLKKLFTEQIIAFQNEELCNALCSEISKEDQGALISEFEKSKKQPTKSKSIRILTVDDSQSIIAFYKGIFSENSFIFKIAMNGKEAMQVLHVDRKFDIIFVDMNMPLMNGVELTRKIREIEALKATPVIMVTTETESSQKEIAKKAGVTDFISKPFSADLLLATIKKYVPS